MSVPLRGYKLLLFCVASCFHLFLLEYRVILEKERGKSRKGKKTSDTQTEENLSNHYICLFAPKKKAL